MTISELYKELRKKKDHATINYSEIQYIKHELNKVAGHLIEELQRRRKYSIQIESEIKQLKQTIKDYERSRN